jgi:hypothetical protein
LHVCSQQTELGMRGVQSRDHVDAVLDVALPKEPI